MFSTLSNLPAVNTYVFVAIAIAVAYIAFSAGRSAYRNVGCNVWLRYIRWAACALFTALLVSALTVGRWVPTDHVGVSKSRVYSPGWHVYPRESFATLSRAGMFYIPYPDDRRFLEVSYLITDSERLRMFSEEIAAFKNPIANGVVLFGASKRDAWKVSGDPFAAWLTWRTSKYLPSEQSSNADLEGYLAILPSFGVSSDARLLVQQWRSRK
jgi:hypothetical protein